MRISKLLFVLGVFGFSSGAFSQEPSCDALWLQRNSIFKSAGYCFRTPRGISAFGNAGCRFDDIHELPLSDIDRENVERISRAEAMKGCDGAASNSPMSAPVASVVRPAIPVIIEPSEDTSCKPGIITGLDPHGDGFLAVKAAPQLQSPRIDKLLNDQQVYICEWRGDWVGIVYPQERKCGVGAEGTKTTHTYSGPCSSGWVHKNWIRQTAG